MMTIARAFFAFGFVVLSMSRGSADEAVLCAQKRNVGGLDIGINLALASFGKATNERWSFPSLENLNYYVDRGFRTFRIAIKWERLQPALDGDLSPAAVAGLNKLISRIDQVGGISIIDMHNYMRRGQDGGGPDVIGLPSTGVAASNLADVWSRIARLYSSNCSVWFNLMNEPHDIDPRVNVQNQNAAIAAIRAAGATNLILVSGIHWSNAYSWISSGNSEAMLRIVDSQNNFAFDMHQYLDPQRSGSSNSVEIGAGRTTLAVATSWLRSHRFKAFLGEFGVGRNEQAYTELTALLSYMAENADVWLGGAYWAGGGGWGADNQYTTDPASYLAPADRPQTTILRSFLRGR